MQMNVQVMLRDGICPPDGICGVIVVRPQPEDAGGELETCHLCEGRGVLFEREERCNRCRGAGCLYGVKAWRYTFTPPAPEALVEYLRSIPRNQWQVTIPLCETGGGLTNTGRAQIICGLNGERLASFRGYAVFKGAHAIFYPRAALIVQYSHHRGNGSGTVTLVAPDREAPLGLAIYERKLYQFVGGRGNTLEVQQLVPDTKIAFPSAAVDAAISKAHDYHCRRAYYYDCNSVVANGPSGARRGAGAAFGGLPSPLKGPGIGYRPTAP